MERTTSACAVPIDYVRHDTVCRAARARAGRAGEGGAPPVRAGAAMAALPDGRALVFGGVDEGGRYRNDAYVLDSRRLNWISLSGIARGAPPKPRAYHTCGARCRALI